VNHIAIDLSLSKSQICVRSTDGTIVDERAWPTRNLPLYLAKCGPGRVILESSCEAFAVADIAKKHGHEPVVIPSLLVRSLGVGARGVKNDRKDAQAISSASCQMQKLPSIHIPSLQARGLKALCTSREAIVTTRTKLVNTVRSWLRTQLLSLTKGAPESFPARVRELLLKRQDGLPEHIERLLLVIEVTNEQLKAADKELGQIANSNPAIKQLMTMPGVGAVTASRFYAAVDQVQRFDDAAHLQSYFGLTPGENVTGFKGHRTGVTKAGQVKVRWTLVQSAWTAMRTRPNDPMVIWANQVAARRRRHIAAVALARKMAGILYAMWRDGKPYDPQRGAAIPAQAP
jgi:transposase